MIANHKENGTENRWWSDSEKADTQIFRATKSIIQEVSSKSKGRWKNCRFHYCADGETVETVFSHTITSCKSPRSLRSSRRKLLWRIWILSRGKTRCGRTVEILVRARMWSRQTCFLKTMMIQHIKNYYCKNMENELKKLSQQDKLSKFCKDAGFLTTVEVGQYFMTKDTEEFSQFTDSVACREFTLPRDEDTSEPKGWIRGNTTIGPVLEVRTSYLQGKKGVVMRIESVNKDNSHSWVRISHGLNKFVTHLDRQRVRQQRAGNLWNAVRKFCAENECAYFCEPIKGLKQNHKGRTLACSSTTTVPIGERTRTDIEPEDYSPIALTQCQNNWVLFFVMVMFLEKMMGRFEIWRLKEKSSERSCAISTLVWWKVEAYNGKMYRSFRTRNSLSPRALQGHSGRNLIESFITGQCINSERFLRVHLSHWMCKSIYNPSWIQDWHQEEQNLSKRQTVFFTSVDPMNQEHKDPDVINLGAPASCLVQAESVEETSKTRCIWGWPYNLLTKKGFKFYQTRSNAIILYDTLPAHCIPKSYHDGIWRSHFREIICVTLDLLSKITFEDNWMKELRVQKFAGRSCWK